MRTNPTQSTSEELDLYRALQTLKDRDGNYILSTISFASQYGLQHLIEFIDARLQAYTDEIRRLAEQQQVLVAQTKTMPPKPIYQDWQAVSLKTLNTLATKWGVK